MNRVELKSKAKTVLSGNYWKAFLVGIITAFANMRFNWDIEKHHAFFEAKGLGFFYIKSETFDEFNHSIRETFDGLQGLFQQIQQITVAVGVVTAISLLVAIFIYLFACNPLLVSSSKYFIRSADGENNLNHIGFSFKKSTYLNIVKGMFMKDLFIFLWSLLFVIPGIIKHYAYRMVPYILADNPDMDYNTIIKKSMKMTHGKKWELFVLDLSFVGWYILGMLALGVGVLFVHPYYLSTMSQAYLFLSGQNNNKQQKQDYEYVLEL